MARYVFRLPDVGEGIAEAEVVAWHVAIGDRIEEDGPLADVMTDKATVEMESPVAGIIVERAGDVGDTVAIGAPLVVIETDGAGEGEDRAPAPKAPEVAERIDAENPDAGDAERLAKVERAHATPAGTVAAPLVDRQVPRSTRPVITGSGHKALASPAVRARAQALGVDLATVATEPDGIVRHADLDALLTSRQAAAPATAATAPGPVAEKRAVDTISGAGETIKVIGLRRRIAENMAASKRNIPHFSYVEECDVTVLEDLRKRFNDEGDDRPRLTLLPFLIAAICRSLPEFPMINARYDDEAGVVTRYSSVHLGIATQTDAGLMVPVIRDAQRLGLTDLAREIARLAQAARDGSAKSEELSGSTLTVTSLGPLGGVATTPVINRPEVAIVGPNRIIERPVYMADGAGGERLEKRKLMNLSISCDHRVVDGWDAANFVQAVKRRLEAPMTLLA